MEKMIKRYKSLGTKSTITMVRMSQPMTFSVKTISQKMGINQSDFIRIAIKNALIYYTNQLKKGEWIEENYILEQIKEYTPK